MRILIQNRPEALGARAGEFVQIMGTKRALERMGHVVQISTQLAPCLRAYDVVHLFSLTMCGTAYLQAENARRQQKPVVLSTVYFNSDEYEAKGRYGMIRRLNCWLPASLGQRVKSMARGFHRPTCARAYVRQAWTGYERQQRKLLALVDVLLPNSHMEAESIRRDFGEQARRVPVVVVPNAADSEFEDASKERFLKAYGLEDFVLCVARIASVKNQLALCDAVRDLRRAVVFIGDPERHHLSYFAAFREKLRRMPQAHYLGHLEPPMVASAYKAAAVHVLPSWLETPGLASLEAALAGCRVVSTDRGSTREYLGGDAHYCSPDSVESIRTAIDEALASSPSETLRARVREQYTWARAAQATLSGYALAIERQRLRATASAG